MAGLDPATQCGVSMPQTDFIAARARVDWLAASGATMVS